MSDKLNIQSPKGMHDLLADEYILYQNVFDKAEEIASYYGFKPIQTPHLESLDLFTATVGVTSDIVEKQMYYIKNDGDNSLVLRPEGTAPVMRAYIEHGLHTLPQPVMLWYKGSFFRHENPQKGRFREFFQFGLEIIGESKPIGEVMIIQIFTLALKELGLGPVIVHINSVGDKECRGEYRKKLIVYYRKHLPNLCKDCKRRFKENPLRLLDCKETKCAEIKRNAPQSIDSLCAPCKQHFKETLEFLENNGINYYLDTKLVRGLDYYTRTVFEIFLDQEEDSLSTNLPAGQAGSGLALAAGGRYDSLAKILGKRDISAVGGGMGADRVVMAMQEKRIAPKPKRTPKVFLIQLSQSAKQKSMNIIEMFRTANVYIAQSINKDNLNSQLSLASKMKVPYVLILGQKEVLENSIMVRDMDTGAQESVPMEKVVEIIKKKITGRK